MTRAVRPPKLVASVLGAAALTACASTGGGGPEERQRDRTALVETEGPDPGILAAADIPQGRCGMILWTRSGANAVPIFRSVDDGRASMVIDGAPTRLTLTGRGGESRLGIPSVQRFEGQREAGAVEVTVRAAWGQPFPAGAYVQDAAVTIRGADGWTRIVPTAGIAGCKP